jgi:DNA polymerase V
MSPTADTSILIRTALLLVESMYRQSTKYVKAGILLGGIVPENSLQGDLFSSVVNNKNQGLMKTIDNINFSMRDDMVKFASSGLSRNWKMRQEMRSKRSTTRWDELFELSN